MALLDPNRSLWMATDEATTYPSLAGSERADIVVIGGGITGLTTALLLLQRGVSVVVVEALALAAGTTGYTTAKVTSLHSLTYADLSRTYGRERAQLYGEAHQAAIAKVAELVESLGIDCQFTRAPSYTYTTDASQRSAIEDEVSAAQALGLPASFTEETELPYAVEAAIRFDDQAHFHPRRYVLGLARAIEEAGGRIYERTRVLDVDRHDGGIVAKAEGGEVHADAAVIATLLPFLDIGGFFAKAHPSRSYALSARSRGPVPAGMYINIDTPTRSIRPVDLDGAAGLILGGSSHKPGEEDAPEQYYSDLEAWARDTFDIEDIEHRWSAQDYVTIDKVPFIGRSPRTRNIYVGTGYKKWGMTGGTVAGMIIADLIVDIDNPWLGVFDATRVAGAGTKEFVKENVKVGMHFVGDRIRRLRAADVSTVPPGEGRMVSIDGNAVGAYRDEDGTLHAVSITCTHMGCTLKWNQAETSWDCPCHGSRFTYGGDVIEGPAVRALERVALDATAEPEPS